MRATATPLGPAPSRPDGPIYSVALRECQNVRQVCEPRPVDVTLAGGQRRVVMRIEPRNANMGFSFRYSFAWRPAESAAQ